MSDQCERQRIRCAPMLRFAMGSTEELIYLPLMKRSLIMPSATVALLQTLLKWRPEEAHLRELVTRSIVPADRIGQFSSFLREAYACGALISVEELIQHCRSTAGSKTPKASIETVCMPTRDRPSELQRCMASYLANLRRWGRGCSILILDDSTAEATQRQCRELVRAQARDATERVFLYAGLPERQAFLRHLCDRGLREESVTFALFGAGGGSDRMGGNRNAFLLATAGTVAFSVDDDTVCEPAVAEGTDNSGISIDGEKDSTELWFCATRQDAVDAVERCDTDVIGRHEALIGMSMCDVVGNRPNCDIHMDEICSHLLSAIATGSGAIGLTANGVYGDSGMYAGDGALVACRNGTRSRLTASKAALRCALTSREIVRQVPRLSIGHSGHWMGTFFGLDNRSLLPPFLPVFRNEDSIFGCLTQYCRDDFLTAHLPFSLLHAPPVSRTYHPSAASEIRVSDIVLACISMAQLGAKPVRFEDRLRKVGSQLLEVGRFGVSEFREFLSLALWSRASKLIVRLESELKQQCNEPEYWADEVRCRIDRIRSAVVKPEYLVASDIARPANLENALRDAQRIVSLYGRLLCEWPEIVAVARGLAGQGICLGRPV